MYGSFFYEEVSKMVILLKGALFECNLLGLFGIFFPFLVGKSCNNFVKNQNLEGWLRESIIYHKLLN